MENPIQPSGMFATPINMESLMAYCERFTGAEKIAAFTAAGMAWNLAHKIVKEAIEEQSK